MTRELVQQTDVTLPSIWSSIRIAWEDGNAPSEQALQNATELLTALKGPPPDWAGRGDWPTVCLHWTSAQVEIEIYDDVLQLCQFAPTSHTAVEVQDFDATAEGINAVIAAMAVSDQRQLG